MVKAIAPKAPIGATFMIKPTMPNSTCGNLSITLKTSLPRSPSMERAKPNMMAKNSTCRISPLAKASTTVLGMILIRKSIVPCESRLCCVCGQRLGIQLGHIGVHARPWLHDADHQQADRQSKGRDDLEVRAAPWRPPDRPSSCPPCRQCRLPRCRR